MAGTSSRGNPALGDILRTVGVLGAIVLGIWLIGQVMTVTPKNPVKAVDYRAVVEQARPAASFPLLAPEELPDGWVATSARFSQTLWHLGILTDQEDYIGLEQIRASKSAALQKFAEDSKADGTANVAGSQWEVYDTAPDNTTYVRRSDGITVLVIGSAPRHVMETYIEGLSDGS